MILSREAWLARGKAVVRSGVKVGAAVLTEGGLVYAAANIELEFRLGLHAEVAAIAKMLSSAPSQKITAILIAAEAERFTPCGGCMDWVMQVGIPGCTVIHEDKLGRPAFMSDTRRLMPFYPKA